MHQSSNIPRPFYLLLLLFILGATSIYLSSQSIRLDEAQTIWVATKPLTTVYKLIAEDVHVPLYFTILHFWMQLFGDNIIIARLPSYIFYLLTLPVLYILVKRASNERMAFLTTSLFCLSPFVVWYSFEARMYTQLTLAATLSSLTFLTFINTEGKSAKLSYALATLFGLYTHYFFTFLLFSQGVYVVLLSIQKAIFLKSESEESFWQAFSYQKKLLINFFTISGLCVLALVPWVIYVLYLGQISNSEPLIPPPSSFNILQTFAYFIFGFQNQFLQGVIVAFWPLSLILLLVIFTGKRRFQIRYLDYFAMVTFLPILIDFSVSLIKPIFLARYLIFTVPTFFFLIAVFLISFSPKVSRVLIIATFILILGFLIYQNLSSTTPVKEDYRAVVTDLNTKATPSDIILVSAPFTVYPIEYYYHNVARIDTIPLWDRFNQGAIPAFSPASFESQIKQDASEYSRGFVVLSYNQGYEAQIRKYLDNHYQLLFHKQYSPGLELRVYKFRYD